MKKECIYVADTPNGHCCTINDKQCLTPCFDECDEPGWEYLLSLVKEHIDEIIET